MSVLSLGLMSLPAFNKALIPCTPVGSEQDQLKKLQKFPDLIPILYI